MVSEKKKGSLKLQHGLVRKISIMNGGFFILICILTLLITMVIESCHHIEKDREMMRAYLSNTLYSVDNSLKDMGRVSLICFSDDRTQEILKSFRGASYREQLEQSGYLGHLYTSLVSIRNDITGIYITDTEGIVFSQDRFNPGHSRLHTDEHFVGELLEAERMEGNVSGCKLVQGVLPDFRTYPVTYTEDPGTYNCLYLIRPVRSFSPHEVIGHIALLAPVRVFGDLADEYLDPRLGYAMVGEDGRIISCGDKSLIGSRLAEWEPLLDQAIREGREEEILSFGEEQCLVSWRSSEYSRITLIVAKPLYLVADELFKPLVWCVIISLSFGLAAVVITYMLTGRGLRPVTDFAYEMAHFKKDDLTTRYPVGKMDEVGILRLSFNEMMDDINELIVAEYEGKVRLQQAQNMEQNLSMLYLKNQINPHFLYNTLDVIRMKAALEGAPEVADILMELVTFFRLSTRVDSQFVTLKQETDMLDAYMKLMKFRYPKLLYEREIPQELLTVRIPNFILQPIVENSLLHGLRDRKYKGCIRLRAFREREEGEEGVEQEVICIEVADDGVGMRSSVLRELNGLGGNASGLCGMGEDGHIGIRNVQARLGMYYGKRGRVVFDNNEQGGVTARIYVAENKADQTESKADRAEALG